MIGHVYQIDSMWTKSIFNELDNTFDVHMEKYLGDIMHRIINYDPR